MDGMLSQEEINALLNGIDSENSSSDTDTSAGNASGSNAIDEALTPMERDMMGEISNISMGTAATTLSSLVNQKVDITTPKVELSTWQDLVDEYDRPCVFIQISYKEGINGNNVFILKDTDVKVIADLMMGGDGTNIEGQIGELHLSAICEAMNQMMGSASTSLSSMLGIKIDISPPTANIVDLNDDIEGDDITDFLSGDFVKISFKMTVGDLVDSEIMQLYPVEFCKTLCNKLGMGGQPSETTGTSEPEPEPVVSAAPQPQETPTAPVSPSPTPSQQPVPDVNMNYGMPMQEMPMQGMPMQGMPMQGMPMQGMPMQGMPMQGMPMQNINVHIDLVIVATSTPDYQFPSIASILCDKLGLKNAFAFDMSAACCGFLYMMETAANFIRSGRYKKVIIVGADKMSSIVNYTDRATCPIFGDGAAAFMMEPTTEELGVMDAMLRTDGKGLPFLHLKAGGSVCPPSYFTIDNHMHYLYQEGRTVFKYAVSNMSDISAAIAEKNNLTKDTIDWVIPHQANLRIIDAVAHRLEVPHEKVLINIDRYGNTSAGTLPLCIWDFEEKLKKGDNLIFTAFGAGFTWGAVYVKWGYDGKKQ